MRLRRRRRCKVLTGPGFVADARYQCELPDDGHEWHERFSVPFVGRWREIEGGYEYRMVRLG